MRCCVFPLVIKDVLESIENAPKTNAVLGELSHGFRLVLTKF